MSTTPRPPLLRDKSIESMARNFSDAIVSATIMDSDFDDRVSEAFRTGEEVGRNVRRLYEDLITDGKLRVVEEVELDESSYCLRCGYDVTDRSEEVPPYCHGCGNPIKR
jgi:hypothetical protein